MDQNLWRSSFRKSRIPAFSCPECGEGKLELKSGSYQSQEGKHFKDWKKDTDNEDIYEGERFICFLVCDIDPCAEIIAVSGAIGTVEEEVQGHQRLVPALEPKSMYPAPHIFRLSERLKPEVEKALIESFELYWTDKSACANRIRAAVEALLDGYKIPRTTINKKHKRVDLNLSSRIDKFAAKITGHTDALNALRTIGNVGSHKGGSTEEEVLTAYRLLEGVLAELIDKKSVEELKLAKKIVKDKGRLK